jgi:hypothetical protein
VEEPGARPAGAPELALVRYIEQATALRQAAWRRHFSLAEMSRFQRVDAAQWAILATEAERLMAAGVAATSLEAQALAGRLQVLIGQAMGHDPQMVRKMAAAMAAEPLLSAGASLPTAARAYLQAAASAARPLPRQR